MNVRNYKMMVYSSFYSKHKQILGKKELLRKLSELVRTLGELTKIGRVGNWASWFLGEFTKFGRVGFWASWESGELTRTQHLYHFVRWVAETCETNKVFFEKFKTHYVILYITLYPATVTVAATFLKEECPLTCFNHNCPRVQIGIMIVELHTCFFITTYITTYL